MKKPYRVRAEQAAACAQYLLATACDGTPLSLDSALNCYEQALAYGNTSEPEVATAKVAEAIERWLRIDRAGCIAVLGPGLGL